MKGKKFLAMILSAALGMSTFAACGRRVVEPEKKTTETEAETETEETEKLRRGDRGDRNGKCG